MADAPAPAAPAPAPAAPAPAPPAAPAPVAVDRRLLAALLGRAAPGVEVELRLQHATRDIFAQVYDRLAADGAPFEERCTVDAVESYLSGLPGNAAARSNSKHIRTTTFERLARVPPDRYSLKLDQGDPVHLQVGGVELRLAAGLEGPAEPWAPGDLAVVRAKRRRSFRRGPWRLDLTAVLQLGALEAQARLRALLPALFGGPWPPAAPEGGLAWEVEAEWAPGAPGGGPGAALSEEAVLAAARELAALVPEAARRQELLEHETRIVAQQVAPAVPMALRGRLKMILPQVKALTGAAYRGLYPPVGYYLTDKADGVRAVAHVFGGGSHVLTAERLLPGRAGGERTLVDGELVGDTLYAFDVMVCNNLAVTARGFEERAALLPEAVAALRKAGIRAEAKQFTVLLGEPALLQEAVEGMLRQAAERPYRNDGLILVKPGAPYAQTATWKWKPPEHNTIDFLARRAPPGACELPGAEGAAAAEGAPVAEGAAEGAAAYILFVGANRIQLDALGLEPLPCYEQLFGARAAQEYMPIQFEPASATQAYWFRAPAASGDLDGRVVELAPHPWPESADVPAGRVNWQLRGVRTDRQAELSTGRYYGNDIHVAMDAWLNFVDPLTAAQLWSGVPQSYFQAEHDGSYAAQIYCVSMLKEGVIQDYARGAAAAVDLACGRGQDADRYRRAGVGQLVGVDQDGAALAEFGRRLMERRRGAPAGRLRVALLRADLSELQAADVLELVRPPGPVPVAVCNLAIHYLFDSSERVAALAALLDALLLPNGVFICTAFLGEAVLAALAGVPEGGTWDLRENGVLKYSLRRDYKSAELTPAGQRIGVLLPFSQGQYYEEFLVNSTALAEALARYGFRLLETRVPEARGALSAADREYLKLFGAHVFRRGDGA